MAKYEFYYDRALKDKNLTFRLVGSKLSTESDGSTTVLSNVENSDGKYGGAEEKVILRDIIKSPVQVSVNHNYAYTNGDLTNIVQNWTTSLAQWQVNWESFKARFMNTLGQFEGQVYRSPADFIQLVNGSDFYKVFTGTEVEIPFNFECRLYTRKLYDSTDSTRYVTPVEQLQEINKYFLGVYGESNSTTSTPQGMIMSKGENTSNYFKWYTAPHGYMGLASDNFTPEGTLSLFYGKTAVIDNLLLKNYNFTYSRELLYMDDAVKGPLYIDLAFSLIPAIIFTVGDLNSIVTLEPNVKY